MKHWAPVVAGLLSILAVSAYAQEPGETGLSPVVGIGNRVRLESTAVGGRIQGLVVALDDEMLTLATDGGVPITVPSRSITSLDISLGRKRHVLQGLVLGAAGGLLYGLIAPVDRHDCDYYSSNFCSRGEAIGGGTVGFAVMGAAVGAFVKRDRWGVVPLSAPSSEARRGFSGGLAVAVRF